MVLNPRGVRKLADGVVLQAYIDYYEDGKDLASLRDPFRSENTFHSYNAIFNKILQRMKQEDIKFHRNAKYKEMARDVLRYATLRMRDEYANIGERLIEINEFLYSDRLQMFTKKYTGEQIRQRAEENIERWANGEEVLQFYSRMRDVYADRKRGKKDNKEKIA